MLNISEPVVVIDEETTRSNIRRMVRKIAASGALFRPHFKTHQSVIIGEWFKEEGITAITVSSIKMAEYFASHGWEDILIAFLYFPQSIERLNRLAETRTLSVITDNETSLRHLADNLKHKAGLWIKTDCGYNRTGIPITETERITRLVTIAAESDKIDFKGIITHAGNSYRCSDREDLYTLFRANIDMLGKTVDFIQQKTGIKPLISWGDTPTCSVIEDLTGVDEIRCGNFVFYDLMQYTLGACNTTEISTAIYCPVVGVYPERDEFAIYGGAVHLSKEHITDKSGRTHFGFIGLPQNNRRWTPPLEETRIKSLSQEHGIVSTTPEIMKKLQPGDIVAVYPVHSCLSSNLADHYLSLSGQLIPNINSTSRSYSPII